MMETFPGCDQKNMPRMSQEEKLLGCDLIQICPEGDQKKTCRGGEQK